MDLPAVPGYEVLGVLGRGGMGVVYKARQLNLDRFVALKVLLAGPHADPLLRARFRVEAEMSARLAHPNIVTVFDVGEAGGLPYLALEYVEGTALARELAGTPRPGPDAAGVVRTLARALHHAHQQGVLHRDLKPANVLVARDGTLKVADFGLARRVEGGERLSQTGAILGTPPYMAPEQASGVARQVTAAVDVYALGAILYELLTGRPPFLAADSLQTLLLVLTTEPVPPRRLDPEVPADLETICLKCLRKQPEHRYATAAALADDLDRFLEGQPIHARPVSRWERAWKWARRRPAAALLVVVSVLATVTLLVRGWLANARLQFQKGRAEGRLQRTLVVVNRLLWRVRDDLDLWADTPEVVKVRQKFLADLLDVFEELKDERSDDPRVRLEIGRVLFYIGTIQNSLGRYEAAAKTLGEAIDLFADLERANPRAPEYPRERAQALYWCGVIRQNQGRRKEAEEALRAALEVRAELARRHPEPAHRQALAQSWSALGEMLGDDAAHREALRLREHLVKEHPEDADYQSDLAQSHHDAARRLYDKGRFAEAEHRYRQELALRREVLRRASGSAMHRRNLGLCLGRLANVLRKKRRGEAAAAFAEAEAVFRKLARDFPNIPTFQMELAAALSSRGFLLAEANQPRQAGPLLDEAVRLGEALLPSHGRGPEFRLLLAGWYSNRGAALLMQDQVAGALADFDRAYRLAPKPALTHNNRGRPYLRRGDLAQAIAALDRAIALGSKDAETYYLRGSAHGRAGNFVPARADFEKAVQLAPEQVMFRATLAWLLAACPADTVRDGRRAVEHARKACALNPKDAGCLDVLAAAFAEAGQLDQAVKAAEQVLAVPDYLEREQVRQRLELYRAGKPYRDVPWAPAY
jgi:serine/threonine-protein kinase